MAATFDQAATAEQLAPKKFEALVTTTFGTTLDPKNSQSSFTLEPQLAWNLSGNTALTAYTEIDRPLNPYENFSSPVSYLLLTHKVNWVPETKTTLRFAIRANNLHRWKYDGYQLRSEAGIQLSRDLGSQFSLMGRAWTYGDLNEYRQTTSGKALPLVGFGERVALSFSPGNFNFELHVIVGQSYHGQSGDRALWKNSIVTAEVAEYRFNDTYTVGVSHELVHSLIDETTGLRGTLKIFDGRASRLSAYMALSI
ncbi:MAG: hypothetical protein H6617_06700 [Bdellovibrionaceae bacterium]|nr:hypothetical protein [Pseudobdellovibrionaceae bacterium]